MLAVCCSRWLTFFLLDHMYLMIPYTNLTILHMWLMIETSIIASLLSRKFRQKERVQFNLLPTLANSARQPSFLTITICKEEPYGKAKGTRFRWWISTRDIIPLLSNIVNIKTPSGVLFLCQFSLFVQDVIAL